MSQCQSRLCKPIDYCKNCKISGYKLKDDEESRATGLENQDHTWPLLVATNSFMEYILLRPELVATCANNWIKNLSLRPDPHPEKNWEIQ